MIVVVSSDYHADWRTSGVDRYQDVRSAAIEVVTEALNVRADLFLFLGDLTDPDNPRSHRAVALGVEIATILDRDGIENRWLVGNHDTIEDGSGLNALEPIDALRRSGGLVGVYSSPRVEVVKGAAIVALPFTPASHAYDPEEFIREVKVPDTGRVIVIGHLNIEGIVPGSETDEMPRGREVFWPIEAIRNAPWFDRAICFGGHYHKRQVFEGINIPGSLARLTHGDERDDPGFLIAEL